MKRSADNIRIVLAALVFCALAVSAVPQAPGDAANPVPAQFTAEEYAALAPHFVVVKLFFKRSEEEIKPDMSSYFDGSMEDYFDSSMYENYINNKRSLKATGVVIAPDTVVAADMAADEQYLDHFEVEDARGNVSRAERSALLKDTPGLLLKIAEPQKLQAKPVEFTGALPASPGAWLFAVSVSRSADYWTLGASRVGVSAKLTPDGATELTLGGDVMADVEDMGMPGEFISRSFSSHGLPQLFLSQDKKPVGIGLDFPLSFKPGSPPLWIGKDILADERIPFEALNAKLAETKAQFDSALLEIRVALRQKVKDSGMASFMGISMPEDMDSFDPEEGRIPKEVFYYGLRTGPRQLFVPSRIRREHAKLIDSIEVKTGDRTIPGKFVGTYEDVAAFLVSVDEDLPGNPVEFASEKSLPETAPLLTVKAEHKAGGKKITTNYTRAMGKTRGYKDELGQRLLGPQTPPVGTFITDFQGKVCAVRLEQRKEGEEKPKRGGYRFYESSDFGKSTRVYAMGELGDYFANAAGHLDKTIMALSEDEDTRRMWLGVEFEPMTKELAKTMNVEAATKDGAIGLVVSTVYRGSPAERLGILSGDILLKIQEAAETEPTYLHVNREDDFDFDFSSLQIPAFAEQFGVKMPEKKAWKSQNNVLTRLLEVIGEGNEATLTYLTSQGEEKSTNFIVERAPRDFESAGKFKDDSLGLTIKELTFEVRQALKVPDEQNPVVVAKVEEGMPADVAKVKRYELITRINDADVNGLDGFQQLLEAARAQKDAQGKGVFRLTLQSLGNTRLADVTVE